MRRQVRPQRLHPPLGLGAGEDAPLLIHQVDAPQAIGRAAPQHRLQRGEDHLRQGIGRALPVGQLHRHGHRRAGVVATGIGAAQRRLALATAAQ
ncbi:hypothetical protein ACLESD_49785, partial [Pyxidicoccus sp. 3LFB2]